VAVRHPCDLALLPPSELAEFNAGRMRRAHRLLGAHVLDQDGVAGTRFAVWAPDASRVAVAGDFNGWNAGAHPLAPVGSSGVWATFVPGAGDGQHYKYALQRRDGAAIGLKADPYARRVELRPGTASLITAPSRFQWSDAAWLRDRPDWRHAPLSIYEMHAGSWRRDSAGRPLGWRALAEELLPWLQQTGFTHVELLPVTEHPLDESWGYQCTGYFAPTRRHGEPDDLRWFIDRMHSAGIGVILDWVPGHFPRDEHALARYDGTALYEHEEPRRAEAPEWGTLKFNFGRHEVQSFLISSAIHWLEDFHADGLRVDAVASMLYLDYGRRDGDWIPNVYGGREDLEAIAFLRELNIATHAECPGTMTIAEESTDWVGVSRPVWLGGLGFSMKWDMGWMHDTLDYLRHDPVHRRHHHDRLTFGMLYAHSENFVLPLSHDEVVHGKGSLYARMPGDDWQKHANLRLLYAWQFTHPGKKLLFMGGEIAARGEWAADRALDLVRVGERLPAGLLRLVGDLNRLYRGRRALHGADFEPRGFEWLDCNDAENSALCYLRRDGDDEVIVVLNFTPVPRHGYRVGVPGPGHYRELLNTDAACYGGSNLGNGGGVDSEARPWMGRPHSLLLTLPPLAALVLSR
jgi:1,4-alpha-glucan branching enzyme